MPSKEKSGTRKPLLDNPKRTNARSLAKKKFHRLTVIEETDERASNGAIIWRCECKCGTKNVMAATHNLTSHNTTSCGCYQLEISQKVNTAAARAKRN